MALRSVLCGLQEQQPCQHDPGSAEAELMVAGGEGATLTLPASCRQRGAISVNRHEPMFNVQASVLALLGPWLRSICPHGASGGLGYVATLALAFIPARYSGSPPLLSGGDIAAVTSFLTHAFVHGDWVHLGLNAAWLVAFGGAVANRIGTVRFLLSSPSAPSPALQPSGFQSWRRCADGRRIGAISGLMGATMRFLFTAVDGRGLAALREDPRSAPLMPLGKRSPTSASCSSPPCFWWPISWQYSVSAASAKAVSLGRRISAAISPAFYHSAFLMQCKQTIHPAPLCTEPIASST